MWMQPPSPRIVRDQAADVVVEGTLCDKLKTYYDRLTLNPAPDGLLQLTEALDAAFERGDLRCGSAGRST